MTKRTPQELGYLVPVLMRIEKGRYKKAYAKSLKPQKGIIKVRYDNGKNSTWTVENVLDFNLKPIV